MSTLQKGQRVQTPLGAGTVVGFERFTPGGFSAPLSDTDNEGSTSRVVVQLDRPENWLGTSPEHPDPYMYRSQLSELKEES